MEVIKEEKISIIKPKEGFIKGIFNNIRKHPVLYIMAIPVIIYYILFHYFPMYGVVMSFQRFVPSKGFLGSEWVGFDHFISFFNDVHFWRLMRNTFLMSFYDLLFGFPVPIIFALLLNEIKSEKFKKITQTVTYMPHFISLVVICSLILTFTRSTGPITWLYTLVTGKEAISLLSRPEYFRTIYIASNIWQGFGWGSIIYFASISSIDPTLYEAAAVDGANRFKQALNVTLPSIMPTIVIMLILRMGQIMSVGFEKIILMYNPLTYEVADVISTYVYRKGLIEFNYSYSAAIGLFNSIINFALILAANKISKKVNETSLW
ncbi:MAG: ABC transporter permease [Cellulosilyticaceae bacterium]